jgi:hypothetical protein
MRQRVCKKNDLTRHHPADAQLRAPLLAIGAYAALSPGQQGRRAKDPRIQGAKDLAHRPREAEPKVVEAAARIAVAAATSCPHAPGVAAPGAAAKNPGRARR